MRTALLTALVATSACLSRPALVPRTFSIDAPAGPGAPPSADARVIRLRRVEVAPPFDGRALVYRTGDHRLERDPYASFVASPAELLTTAIRGYLRTADFVRGVVAPGEDLPADLLMEVQVLDLSADLGSAGEAAGVLRLEIRVRPARAAEPAPALLWREYASRRRLPRRTADAIVAAWNGALAEIMAEFLADLRKRVGQTDSLPSFPGDP